MSTTRRRLGTGPNATQNMPTADAGPRLLPAERVEQQTLLGDVERQDVVDGKGRRILGPGMAALPEEAPYWK